MANLIQTYYEQAQLSDAAYADLVTGMSPADYRQALRTRGFTVEEAAAFAGKYSIIDTFVDDESSFFAVLFQEKDANGNGTNKKTLAIRGTNDPFDLFITDQQLALFGAASQNFAMRASYADILAGLAPADMLAVTGHSLGGFLAQALSADFSFPISHVYTYNAPGLNSFLSNPFGLLGISSAVPNSLITNLVGQGQTFVASTGTQFGSKQSIFIEETSVFPNPVANHLIGPLKDSLALYALFATIDSTVEEKVSSITEILNAASRTPATSLEQALDDLRRLFLGPNIASTPVDTPADYYNNITAVKTLSAINGSARVFSLTNLSASSIAGFAKQDIAYRYALQELNPFVVLGANIGLHNAGGALDLYDAQTGNGTMTALYLSDRAELLAKRLTININDGGTVQTDTHYVDVRTGFGVGSVASANEVIFGDAQDNRDLLGHAGGDHLYGGDGNDLLASQGGMDYLEGNQGDDELYGGSENDILLGQQGDDQLFGEAGNDRLNGGLGDDLLDGGTGLDTYFYRTGQGLDRIVDADKVGTILFDNQTLVGGIRREGAPVDTYTSPDGQFTYVKSGTDLVINGTLTVKNFDFQTGALGIKLSDAGNLVDSIGPVIDYNNGLPNDTITLGNEDNNGVGPLGGVGSTRNTTVFANGGNDWVFMNASNAGNNQLFGGTGADLLEGALGNDRLYGEGGRDILIGLEGDDVLDGGDQEDALSGGLGDDVLDGGTGDDSLTGNGGSDVLRGGLGADFLGGDAVITALADMGADFLDGGAGDDWLFGFLGDDVLEGGTEDDLLYGDTLPAGSPSFYYEWPGLITPVAAVPFTSLTGGDDFLNGGAGADYLQGDAGDDILLGGADNDELVGDDLQVGVVQEGADWLEGEGGNDTLVGGGGEDALFGGDGNDVLVGDYANNAVLGFDDTLDGGAELTSCGGAAGLISYSVGPKRIACLER